MTPEVQAEYVAMLQRDNARMRVAGCGLAGAAMRVVQTYDGVHRLALAVAAWAAAIAAEGDRPRASASPLPVESPPA